MMRSHPARQRLEEINRGGRWLYELTEDIRTRGADWPTNIYCPSRALIDELPDAIARIGGLQAVAQLEALGPLGISRMLDPLLTMAAWRMTQGIYRIDPALYPALIDTPLDGDIPADALDQLPEWCTYVETPNLRTMRLDGKGEFDILGAWARIDEGVERVRTLVIALNVAGDEIMGHQHIPLSGNITSSVQAVFDSWRSTVHFNRSPISIDAVLSYVRPIINLLLYIAAGADFSRRGALAQPVNPQPTRTRRHGLRIFPASGPTEWDVGVRLGAALRAAYHAAETGQADDRFGPRPHVRRAHWHTFVSGRRMDENGQPITAEHRQRAVRWLPPIPVNIDDVDALPAVIRPVKNPD